MDNNYMKTILSGVKEWTESLTDDAKDKANNALDKANKSIDKALFVVNITSQDGATYSADKTFDEIVQVYNEGKYNIVANIDGVYIMPLSEIERDFAMFSGIIEDRLVLLGILSDNKVLTQVTPLATETSKLPNPYPLTFTGAVSETYDGSSAKTIEIPSGGSGAHSDWNQNDSTAADYIKNRPFYMGDPVETVLVEERTVSFTDGGGGRYAAEVESTFEATAGEIYKVSWDGTVYECTCVDFNKNPFIGNLSILGAGSDTGEPFIMGVVNGVGISIITADTSASHTFSISIFVQEVVKIDTKYLPVSTDDSYGVIKKSDIVSTYNFPAKVPHDQMVDAIIAFNTGNASIVWGEKVINASYDSSADTISVTFAYEPLRIHTYENNDGFYYNTLGSVTYAELQGSLMRIGDGDAVYTILTTEGISGDKTLRVRAEKISIDDEFRGNAVVLRSSTDKSTKMFKITVDDSGTIAVTEVV